VPPAEIQPAEVIGAIPARYGSTRMVGKPLRSLAGKPLIEHVYRQARKAKDLSRVIVLTDDERIAAAIDRFGGDYEMTPVDCTSGTDRIAYAARGWEEAAVVNIQGDEPMIDPEAINRIARHLVEFPDDPMVTLAAPAGPEEASDPNVVKVAVAIDGRAMYFSRSVLPYPRDPRYSRPLKHIGIYGYQRQALLRLARLAPSPLERAESLEQLRALENGIPIRVLTTSRAWLGVDTMEDLAKVEELLSKMRVEEEDRPKATPA
jgi:3-deoxy-manno-octulosonate cytidylyltransferase (CMP-KDO synthetase)